LCFVTHSLSKSVSSSSDSGCGHGCTTRARLFHSRLRQMSFLVHTESRV
jgi:hypothetical protein